MLRSAGILIGLTALSSVEAQGYSMCQDNNDYRGGGIWSYMCLNDAYEQVENVSNQAECEQVTSNSWYPITCSQVLHQSVPDGNSCADMGEWNYWWQHSIAISKSYHNIDGPTTDCCDGHPFLCENDGGGGGGDNGNNGDDDEQGLLAIIPQMTHSCKPHRKVPRDDYADLAGVFLNIDQGALSGAFVKSKGPGDLPPQLMGASLRLKLTDSHGVTGKLTPHQKHVEGYVIKHIVTFPSSDIREATQEDVDMFNSALSDITDGPGGPQLPPYNPSNGAYRLWYSDLDGALDSLSAYIQANDENFQVEKLRIDGFLWFQHGEDMEPSHAGCMKVKFDEHDDEHDDEHEEDDDHDDDDDDDEDDDE
jgi:hypothetical protein